MNWDLVSSLAAMLFVLLSIFGAGKFAAFRWIGLIVSTGAALYVFIAMVRKEPIDPQLLFPFAIFGLLGWTNLMKFGQHGPKRTKEGKFAPRPSA